MDEEELVRIASVVWLLVFVALIVGVLWGSWKFVGWVFEHDANASVEYCQSLGGRVEDMVYIKNGHYLCLSPDGRVLGRS